MALFRKVRIDNIITETADTKTFYLSLPDGQPLQYEAGQFLTFVFFKPGGEVRRSYSISSAPALNEPLCITVKRLDNGEYSRLLFDRAMPGDELTTTGAGGLFTLPAVTEAYKDYFFIAAGSGITPVYPLIKTLLFLQTHSRLVLIYSNRSVNSTIFYEGLQELLALFPQRFRVEFLFSNAQQLERARLGKEVLANLLREIPHAPYEQVLFYTCGPFDYMRMVSITLLEQGVPLQHIKKENFTPLVIETGTRPPDTHEHAITLQVQNKTYQLQTQYPRSILGAAKAAGIELPYSCEAGRCGSCVATCSSGKVWMSYNEVLMDDEIEKGRVLTCVGYPIGGDISIIFE